MDIGARRQFWRLLTLTVVHGSVDMLGGMLPALLPVIRQRFDLTLTAGIGVLSVLNMVSNAMQIATGHLRAKSERPFFIPLGVVVALMVTLIGFLPAGAAGHPWLYLAVILTGCGIAVVHPEGLRAVHALDRLPSAMSTAVFMTGGFLGFAGGAWVGTALVSRFGLQGLVGIAAITIAGLCVFFIMPIRLAVEHDGPEPGIGSPRPTMPQMLSFWSVFYIAVPTAIGSTLVASLLPTRLNELGFPLTHGGMAVLLFGGGSAVGALAWALLARRRGELVCVAASLMLGIPFLVAYLILIKSGWAIVLLMVTGACAGAAYPILVALARNTAGPVLGTRMAFMVGGTWGTASIVLFALGPVAERWGSQPPLYCGAAGYFIAGILALRLLRLHSMVANPAPVSV